ncbi:hypothetical protein K0M31_012925 [Melipona bicolor]|uniref:Selenoprotein P N-terminal domain-containing protein n=1 Tax=Melipona bicolor TaxID=60889 RepID=A0AA40KGY7_9HYME|nr:hypothetical protein K0M31_012925 [Melipona bicolor]
MHASRSIFSSRWTASPKISGSSKIFRHGPEGESERIMSISIVITIMTMMIVGNYGAYEKDRVLRLLDVPRHFRQTKEPRGYIEQCRATNLRREQLGHVNVFAFLDPSWYYSYRQAVMLGLLKKRLEKSGFSNILFFTVTPPSDLLEDSTENNIEIKAWREISKNTQEFEYSLDSVETLFGDIKEKRKGIILLQDTSELGIWKSFHASKDEVVIIDRCGKVTYQIIVPWSILHFPYVKAAILSTYKDDPCGPCYGQSSTVRDSMDYEEYLLKTINSDETKIDEDLDTQTDKVFSDLETIKTSSEELKQIEDDKNTSTIASFSANIHESIVYDITTKASTVRPTENMRNDDNVRDIFFTDKNIEITSEVPLEQEQTPIPTITSNFTTTEVYSEKQDCIFSNKHVNSNDDVSFTNTDLRRHDKDLQNESNISLEEMKMKEHEAINESTKAKELQSLNDESIPLRIILYAPHLHEENGTLKKYTHLVLNTGSLNYHDHFNSKSTTSDQEPPALKKSDSAILNDRTLAQYVHNVNESPGVYGEIADYWQTVDGNEMSNKNENAELTDYDYVTAEDTGSNINNAFNNESSILRPSDIDAIDSDMNIKNSNDLDDFTQQRLIDHYNKLLTWIYYIV